MIEILLLKTFQGYQFSNYDYNIHKYYIGYTLPQAKKQLRKDFNLKYKRIKFY